MSFVASVTNLKQHGCQKLSVRRGTCSEDALAESCDPRNLLAEHSEPGHGSICWAHRLQITSDLCTKRVLLSDQFIVDAPGVRPLPQQGWDQSVRFLACHYSNGRTASFVQDWQGMAFGVWKTDARTRQTICFVRRHDISNACSMFGERCPLPVLR
eukprot:TRINITY_DN26609_c0_g1_i1.p1 TRINITY_DN26609_c0_g1~~TRINITY_DN26609_c0_g1_i1.p1  ORF type:complete len:156 (-),score=9.68 TRINITY_DN26609_c0_g1_i1:297-764(-)